MTHALTRPQHAYDAATEFSVATPQPPTLRALSNPSPSSKTAKLELRSYLGITGYDQPDGKAPAQQLRRRHEQTLLSRQLENLDAHFAQESSHPQFAASSEGSPQSGGRTRLAEYVHRIPGLGRPAPRDYLESGKSAQYASASALSSSSEQKELLFFTQQLLKALRISIAVPQHRLMSQHELLHVNFSTLPSQTVGEPQLVLISVEELLEHGRLTRTGRQQDVVSVLVPNVRSLKRGRSWDWRRRARPRLRRLSRRGSARRDWIGRDCCAGRSRWMSSPALGVEAAGGCWHT